MARTYAEVTIAAGHFKRLQELDAAWAGLADVRAAGSLDSQRPLVHAALDNLSANDYWRVVARIRSLLEDEQDLEEHGLRVLGVDPAGRPQLEGQRSRWPRTLTPAEDAAAYAGFTAKPEPVDP